MMGRHTLGQKMAPHNAHILLSSAELVYVEEDVIKIQLWSWGDCPG